MGVRRAYFGLYCRSVCEQNHPKLFYVMHPGRGLKILASNFAGPFTKIFGAKKLGFQLSDFATLLQIS